MRSIHSPALGVTKRRAIHPAGAPGPVFTNPFLTPQQIHFGEETKAQDQHASTPDAAPSPQLAHIQPAIAPGAPPPGWFGPWFRSSPTVPEINRVLQDFSLRFTPNTGIPSLLTEDGRQYRAQHHFTNLQEGMPTDPLVFFVKAFQLLDYIRFKAPLPIITDRPYEWVSELCQQGVVFSIADGPLGHPDPGSAAYATSHQVFFSTNNVDAQGNTRGRGLLLYSVPTILWLCAVILHESRHTLPGGNKDHNCVSGDSTLSYGGAYAAQYWWLRGCLEYGIEPPVDRKVLTGLKISAESMFCERIRLPTEATPVAAVPVRAAGDSLLSSGDSPTQNPISVMLARRASVSLSDEQVRQLLWSRRIDDPMLQQAVSQQLDLPWYIIERSFGVI